MWSSRIYRIHDWDAGEQLDAADEVGALRDRLAPPSQLIQVLG